MIISNSQVDMISTHRNQVTQAKRSAMLNVPADMAKDVHISMENGNYIEQLNKESNRIFEEPAKAVKEKPQTVSNRMISIGGSAQMQVQSYQSYGGRVLETEMEFQEEILRRLLGALELKLTRPRHPAAGASRQTENGIRQYAKRVLDGTAISEAQETQVAGTQTAVQAVPHGIGTLWTKTVASSCFYQEEETTAYSAAGVVQTADGRQISFGVQVEMSRSFCEKYEEITQHNYIFTDPLVINYGGDAAKITNQKFLFDLDSDGKAEEMHFTGEGSGFLALDKNGDGIINNGNELFGTKSGDGFRDLAAYDSDGNGWIDEADNVFEDLKIYSKDAQGNDVLISLKEAGVGAIYLGNTSTEFSMKDSESNEMQAQVRKTGVFLFENGGAGTVQHIDFAV